MPDIESFISRWSASGGSEQANSQLFLTELCDELGLPHPAPAQSANERNSYAFERKLPVQEGGRTSYRRIDLYRRGCFVLESKQGQEAAEETPFFLPGISRSRAVARRSRQWEETMDRARRQAENYVRCIPAPEGRPPFIIVCDVGYCFDVYAEFSRSGGMYLPFPDNRHHRVLLSDFVREDVRVLFQTVWNDPMSLDPSRHAAQVTEAVAAHLAELAVRFERKGVPPERVSAFLMRCIFTMFAEDVGLIPQSSFTDMLEAGLYDPEPLHSFIGDLWKAMNDGTVSLYLRQRLKKFNGNIFSDPEVLLLDNQDVGILLEAAKADWKAVEPSIFGTLLERALDPRERHKLGAHYTPRAYVERLVLPTIIQPLREEWVNVQAEASMLAEGGDDDAARRAVDDFHDRLCSVRVLDPACGSGNFLYVTLDHMKRLESEVVAEAVRYGGAMLRMEGSTTTVGLHQFLGLEVNPRAAYIAEMVLWIGYLQWHFREHGNVAPPEPIIRRLNNVVRQDAVLAWGEARPAVNPDGTLRTRWDGVTFKDDPVTGRRVPDPDAQEGDVEYVDPRPAKWPDADFIVGNPPFIGGGLKRRALGDGYMKALASAYPGLPEACDFVMYWWHKAASLVRDGKARRFGFISTNTITQVFNRRITASFLDGDPPVHLAFAIPDHPWVDSVDGAAVRVAMTVGASDTKDGRLCVVLSEQATGDRERLVNFEERQGAINPDLSIGVDVSRAQPLKANERICSRGVSLHGAGFIVTQEEANALGLGTVPGLEKHIRPYRNGRDFTGHCRNVMVIDFYGLTSEEARDRFPAAYQRVYERVKPERDVNQRASRRSNWWIFGEPLSTFRPALNGLSRYISTVETAKHRIFAFLAGSILPDNKLVNIASDDAFHLGILNSGIHRCWASATGGLLEDRPVYIKSVCFDPFPFPDATDEQKQRIRVIAERLDAHRKQQQAEHPELTLTDMYNVLQAMREGRELTDREREINEMGLVTVLKQIHDDLDAAVADAYGWPVDAGEQDILSRVVALNAERAAEESRGLIRWLRPEYQNPDAVHPDATPEQATLDIAAPADVVPARKLPWPREMGDQIVAVRQVLPSIDGPIDAAKVAARFSRARRSRVEEILGTLERLGLIELPLAG